MWLRDKNNFHMWRRQYEIQRLFYNYRQLSFLPPPKYNQNVRRKNPEIPDILWLTSCTASFTLNKSLKMTKSAFWSPFWGIFEMFQSFQRLLSWYFNNNMCFTPIRALCRGGSANQNAVSVTRSDWPAINSVSQLSSFFCFRVSVESSRKAADQHQLEKSQQFCVTLLC